MRCYKGQIAASLVVLELKDSLSEFVLKFLMKKLRLSRLNGGAGLEACLIRSKSKLNPHMILIGKPIEDQIACAELLKIKKIFKDGFLEKINLKQIKDFFDYDEEFEDDFLSTRQKQRIIRYCLDNLRAIASDNQFPGFEELRLTEGDFIFNKCQESGVIVNCFALHDEDALRQLGDQWYKTFTTPQPFDQIYDYFGSTYAIFFSFLDFYTRSLFPLSLIGVGIEVAMRVTSESLAPIQFLYSMFCLLYTSAFMKAWTRKCAEITYNWGVFGYKENEQQRPSFRRLAVQESGNCQMQSYTEEIQRNYTIIFFTTPTIFICLLVLIGTFIMYIIWEEYNKNKIYSDNIWLNWPIQFLPVMTYSISVIVYDKVYYSLAIFLNEIENHRHQSSYDNYLILKLVVFTFANNFIGPLYIAFYLQDFEYLRKHVIITCLTSQIIMQTVESYIPLIRSYLKGKKIIKSSKNKDVNRRIQALKDSLKVQGTYTYSDYYELFNQYGEIILFSFVFPGAALLAFLNNIVLIRASAFKMCKATRRPFERPTDNIGAWRIAFEFLGVAGVLTNCGLAYIHWNSKLQAGLSQYSNAEKIIIFLLLEHTILILKGLIIAFVSDVPAAIIEHQDCVRQARLNDWTKRKTIDANNYFKERESVATKKTN